MNSLAPTLCHGKPKSLSAYTVVQVATNDLIILIAFVPIVVLLLGIGGVSIPWDSLFLSVGLFVVIPLAAGIWTRNAVIKRKGEEYFHKQFITKFNNTTIVGVLVEVPVMLALVKIANRTRHWFPPKEIQTT